MATIRFYINPTHSPEGWSLPPCEGSGGSTWTNCFGTKTTAEGDKYVGEWKDDNRHGQGIDTYADGSVEKGAFRDGEFLE